MWKELSDFCVSHNFISSLGFQSLPPSLHLFIFLSFGLLPAVPQTVCLSFFLSFFLPSFLPSFLSFPSFPSFLSLSREGKGGTKRGRETAMCGCLSNAPYWGPGPQPRHVPWLGFKLVTLWFAVLSSIHWAIPVRTAPDLTVSFPFLFDRLGWRIHSLDYNSEVYQWIPQIWLVEQIILIFQ